MAKNIKFSSKLSTYVTLLGYSVGQTDFWRFPFLVYRNGGGSFLLPFVLVLLLCGIPMYYLEYATSKFSGKGPYGLWDMCPLFRGIGTTVALASFLYIIGPTIFRSWLIEFFLNAFQDPLPWSHCHNPWNTRNCRETVLTSPAVFGNSGHNQSVSGNLTASAGIAEVVTRDSITRFYLNGSLEMFNLVNSSKSMSSAEEFWQFKVLELSTGMNDLNPILWRHIGSSLFQRVLVFVILIRSIKWIEKVMYVTTFVPFILTVAVFVSSLCQPGAMAGLYHYFYPNFDMLGEIRVWIEASLMVFYTMGFGWGLVPMLGSHTDFRENPFRIAVVLPILDALFAIFTGMVCFSVLGNMAQHQGVDVKDVIQAGMSAGIVSYVTALTSLPFPQIWVICFFFSVLLAGLDGQFLVLEMVVQVAGEMFPNIATKYRLRTLAILSAILFFASVPICTGAGVYIFLFVDWYVGAWIGPIVAFVEIVVVAWIYGMDQFSNDILLMTGRPIISPLRIALAFITPLIVTIIFVASCVNYVPPTYGSYYYPIVARAIGWVIVALVISPIVIYAFHVIKTSRVGKTWTSSIKANLEPSFKWGPCEDDLRAEYQENTLRFRGRTLKELLAYTLTGSRQENDADQEMVHL